MSPRKYLLDENVHPGLRAGLQLEWPSTVVWIVGDPGAPPKGTPDPDILIWCEAQGFSLVTNNRASMPVHLAEHLTAGRHIPGIFVLNPTMTISQTIEELALIRATSGADEYVDSLTYLPVSTR